MLLSIINDEPVFPLNWRTLGLPTELKPILHHSLEKEREKRYASGEEMMAALDAISKDAVEAADVAAGASQPEAKSVDTDEAKADSSSDVESAKSDDPPEEVKAKESSSTAVSEESKEVPTAEAEPGESPTGEENAAEAKSEVSPEEATSEETLEDATKAEPEAHSEAKPDEVAKEESAASAKSDASEAEAKTDEAPVEDEPHESEAEANAGEPEAEAKADDATEERPASEAESDESETEAKADEPEAATKSEEPEAEAKTEEPEDAETQPEKPAASAEEIQSLKDESQVLHLSPTLSGDLQGVEISPEEGFLLSRIEGASRPNDIISVSPMADADTARALMDLLGKGLIRLGGVTREPVACAPEPPPPPPPKPKPKPPQGPDAATVSEVDRLLALAVSEDYPALLGLSTDATEAKRKSVYLKIVAKFHPDKFPNAAKDFREKLSDLCASASEAVTDFEKSVAAKKERENGASSPTNDQAASSNGGDPAPFDKRRHARELYDRALSAYDRADYWDTIQLGRRAVEVDEQVAEFYGLLGRALLQNKKWRKEAADNFLKATELEPNNVEFLGMLGAIYESEGLTTRASSLLEKAQAIDPDYEFPDLDGTEVTAD